MGKIQNIIKIKSKLHFGFFIFCISFILIELQANVLLKFFIADGGADPRIHADTYENKLKAKQIFEDLKQTKFEFTPFGLWKNSALITKTCNISEKGIRTSFQPKLNKV